MKVVVVLLALLVCHATSKKITEKSIKEINKLTKGKWKAVKFLDNTDEVFTGGVLPLGKHRLPVKNVSMDHQKAPKNCM